LSKKTGRTVRLPTEAEWEYACRAGTTTAYSFGDDSSKLGGYAWYDGKAHDKDKMYTHPVGTKKPNAWGLYDMHGNVYEWCTDWYDDSYVNAGVRDPMGPATGTYRLARGGSWYGGPQRCRAAYRGRLTPDVRIHVYGFRVVIASRSDVDNTVSTQSRPLAPTPNRGRQLSLNLADGVTMKLVRIKAGKFTRAATKYWSKERPVQQVTLAMPFYMGVTEVTQTQWKAVMKTQPWPQYSSIAGDTAANYINWWDATAFCTALSKKTGRTVRLPTEAEWEYACRAGTTTAYSFGDDPGRVKDRKFVYELGDYAWYEGNTDNRPQPVGKKKPNPWGLYDMHGNVSEWCTDWYAKLYANKGICNPKGPATLRPPGYESTKALFHNHLRHICFAQTLSHAERYHESA